MMLSTTTPDSISDLPDVDERLVTPQTRFEVEDGRWVYVPPAEQPHAESHSRVSYLLHAHCAADYSTAIDMLTRTSAIDDFAPDVSVYPTARDPRTGGRQLEEIAFEIASTQSSLDHVGRRAAKLAARGVRRVFALDLERLRALEWSKDLGQWSILDGGARIEDPALAIPLPIDALFDDALAMDAVAHAWHMKDHPELSAERAEGEAEGRAEVEGYAEGVAFGRAEGLLIMLTSRGFEPTEHERHRILQERDLDRLERWLVAALACTNIAELLAMP